MVRLQLTGPERLRFNPNVTNHLRDLEEELSKEVERMQFELLVFGVTTFETITNK